MKEIYDLFQGDSMSYERGLRLHAEMIVTESLQRWHIQKLREKIDEALVAGDKAAFKRLSKKLNAIMAEYAPK